MNLSGEEPRAFALNGLGHGYFRGWIVRYDVPLRDRRRAVAGRDCLGRYVEGLVVEYCYSWEETVWPLGYTRPGTERPASK